MCICLCLNVSFYVQFLLKIIKGSNSRRDEWWSILDEYLKKDHLSVVKLLRKGVH